jgi:hypothetical protein
MKADSTMIILTIFAMLASAIIITLLIPKIVEPSMKTHGNQQAYVQAKVLASSINALSYADEGEILRSLDAEWDVVVSCPHDDCSIVVSYEIHKSTNVDSVEIMGDVEEFSAKRIKFVKLIKEPDMPVKLMGVSEWDERI